MSDFNLDKRHEQVLCEAKPSISYEALHENAEVNVLVLVVGEA